jgi:hypothetical protein
LLDKGLNGSGVTGANQDIGKLRVYFLHRKDLTSQLGQMMAIKREINSVATGFVQMAIRSSEIRSAGLRSHSDFVSREAVSAVRKSVTVSIYGFLPH